jgi:hypothetical protein
LILGNRTTCAELLDRLVKVATTGTHGDGYALHARAGLFGMDKGLFFYHVRNSFAVAEAVRN